MRATFLVALVDAIGIGTACRDGCALALPLASLVFLGAFRTPGRRRAQRDPRRGGGIVGQGLVYALITLGLIIAVQQLEAHVSQPLVMGRAVSIHPLAIVLAIATGAVLAGIIGAPTVGSRAGFFNSAIRVLAAPIRP